MSKCGILIVSSTLSLLVIGGALYVRHFEQERQSAERKLQFQKESYESVSFLNRAMEKGTPRPELSRGVQAFTSLAKGHPDYLTPEQSDAIQRLTGKFDGVFYFLDRIAENPTRLTPTLNDLQWLERTGLTTNAGVWVTFNFKEEAAAADGAQTKGNEVHLSAEQARAAATGKTNFNPSFAAQTMIRSTRSDLEFLQKEFASP